MYCTRTSYKVFLLNNLNKYLHNERSETEVSINISANNGSEKLCKKNATTIIYILMFF